MRRVASLLMLVATLLVGSIASVVAQEATPAPADDSLLAGLGYPEIRVTSDGTTHDFPTELEAGRYHIVLENTGDVEVDLEIVQLPEGITPDDVNAAFAEAEESPVFVPPDFFYDMTWNGGVWAWPGETRGAVLDLAPGEWWVAMTTYDAESGDEVASGETMLTVTGEMPAVEDPAGVIDIGLVDMDFVVADTLAAGPQIWRIQNNGLQVHHLVMLGVPDGTTEDDVMELAAMFAGPPASPAAAPAINPEEVTDEYFTLLFSRGQFNLVEVDLEPGTYAMVCFMPDPSGTPHVMLGMVEIVVVE